MSKIIGIDFDGTIAKTRYPYVEEIYEEAKVFIRKWRKDGHKIILWTCREGEALEQALHACSDAGIQFDAVNESIPDPKYPIPSRKVYADYYIDDHFPLPVTEQWRLVGIQLRR